MSVQYPIISYGTDGWRRAIYLPQAVVTISRVLQCDIYASRMQSRAWEENTVLQGGRLFHQFVVDCYTPLDNTDYVLLRQTKVNFEQICTKVYRMQLRLVTLTHHSRSMICPSLKDLEIWSTLPRCYSNMSCGGTTGLIHYMYLHSQLDKNSKLLARMTWQHHEDRSNIMAWVFWLQLKQLQSNLAKKNIFGDVIVGTFQYLIFLIFTLVSLLQYH